jgi:hypothetical protein
VTTISIPDRSDTGDPSAQGGTVGALVAAFITLLVAFGVDLTADQTAAILGFVAVAAPLLTAALIRRRAWKPTSVALTLDAVEQAVHDGPPEDLSTHHPDLPAAP